jgi:hypothetical protein
MDELYIFYVDEDGNELNYIGEPNDQIFTSKETAFWYYTWMYLKVPDFKHFESYLKVYRKGPTKDYIFTGEVITLTVPQGTIQRIFKRHTDYDSYHKTTIIELEDFYNYEDFSDKKFREKKYA